MTIPRADSTTAVLPARKSRLTWNGSSWAERFMWYAKTTIRKNQKMDNYQRWLHYERDKENWLKSRPLCSCCGEHIQDEEAYDIDGQLYCPECIKQRKVYLDD